MNPPNLNSMFFIGLSFFPLWLTSDALEQSRQSVYRTLVWIGRYTSTRSSRFDVFIAVLTLTPHFLSHSLPYYSIHWWNSENNRARKDKHDFFQNGGRKTHFQENLCPVCSVPVSFVQTENHNWTAWESQLNCVRITTKLWKITTELWKITTELWKIITELSKITTEPWAFWAIVRQGY